MSNYFWSANGIYQKKKVIEFLSPGFSATNSQGLCLDDLCITVDEIKFLKSQLEEYDIITEANKQDSLNEIESKQYLEKLFKQMKDLNEDQLDEKFKQFFIYGIYDKTTAYVFKSKDLYKSVKFVDLYFDLENSDFNSITLTKDQILTILKSNFFQQPTRNLQFVEDINNLVNLSKNVHFFKFNDNSVIYLIKIIEKDTSNWKIFYETSETDKITNDKFDMIYEDNFKTQLDSIKNLNNYAEMTTVFYRTLIDNLKIVSIQDGKFNFNIFKDNLFIKKYNDVLALENLTLEYFNSVIYQPKKFQSVTLSSTSVGALKDKMAVFDMSNIYYILDETNSYSVRFFKVQYLENDSFKWQILYLFNSQF